MTSRLPAAGGVRSASLRLADDGIVVGPLAPRPQENVTPNFRNPKNAALRFRMRVLAGDGML